MKSKRISQQSLENANEHTPEGKKIVIKLPLLRLKSILILLSILLVSLAGVYWFKNVRPFMKLSGAYVNAYSTLVSPDRLGRIVEICPSEGDLVKKGDLLFSFDRDVLLSKQSKLQKSLFDLNEKITAEKEKMAKAMDGYLEAESIGNIEEIAKHLKIMEDAQNLSEELLQKTAPIKTELSKMEQELKRGAFFAPFDGVILRRYKNEGAVISSGEAVFSLCDPKRIWIEAEVSEKQMHQIAIGTPAKIQVGPNQAINGTVSYIGSATVAKCDHLPFAEKESIPIKISLDSSENFLKPGLSARVELKVR